jgi:hypothetical protein
MLALIEEFRFARDSPLEGDGFDLPHREKAQGFRHFWTTRLPRFVSRTVSDFCIPTGGLERIGAREGGSPRLSEK